MSMRDRFFVRAIQGSLPLIVWAAHFFSVYILAAAQCSPAAITRDAPNIWLLALISAAALGLCGFLTWRAWCVVREAGADPALHDWAAFGSGVLALAGILWSSMPLLMLDGCA